VAKGSTVEFRALRAPENAPAWPADYPHWGGSSGASGNGPETVVTFNAASSSPGDPKMVMATCGNTVSLAVVVVDLAALTVNANRTSPPVESSFPIKEGEHFEVGGTFRFRIALGSWAEPIGLRYELWDTDGWNDYLAIGPGDECTYTFQSGIAEGDVLIRYFIDNDGDAWHGSGEPKNDSPEFWVQECTEHEFDVDYSSKLGTLTISTVRDAFNDAAAVLLKKNTADDYRACVKFTVSSLTQFPANDARPDPADTYERRLLHYRAPSDIALVQKIEDGVVGYCRENNMDEIILDWEKELDGVSVAPRDIAHEIGHGVELHDGDDITKVMYESPIYIPGDQYGTQLTQSDANAYD